MSTTYLIKQVRSANGTNGKQRDTLRSLGLRRIGHTVEHPDSPQLRGMLHRVRHLIVVEEKQLEMADEKPRRRTRSSASTTSSRPPARARTASASAAGTARATARRRAAATRAPAPARAPRTARGSRAARRRSTCGCASCAARTRRCRCRSRCSGRTPSRSTWPTWTRASTRARRSIVAALKAAGLATRRDIPVKVLGRGELTKPLTVHAHGFSKSARAAIEAAGGTCQVIE